MAAQEAERRAVAEEAVKKMVVLVLRHRGVRNFAIQVRAYRELKGAARANTKGRYACY